MTAPWLDRVLAAGATLDLHHVDGRAQLAAAILEAIPRADIVTAIAGSARTVLEQKGIIRGDGKIFAVTQTDRGRVVADGAFDASGIVREIGNNAAATVLCVLEEPLVEDEPAPVDDTPRCTRCHWPLAATTAEGCTPTNCSYRGT